MKEYVNNQFEELSSQLLLLKEQSDKVVEIANVCIDAIKNGHKVIFCGNGGSAAQSQHLAAELVGRYKINRPAMNSISLTVDTSNLTAIGNDYGYDVVFARQLEGVGQKGDILISAAGTIGRTVEFSGDDEYFQDSNIVWIDNNESFVLNTYLLYSLKTVNWKKYATDGSVIPRIYNDNLRSVTVPVPPLAEQQRIVAEISALEERIAQAKTLMAACPEKKRRILDRWLK